MRPYHPGYHPFACRGWRDFGTGALGDIGYHERSAGHWREFLDACRGRKPAGSNFADHVAYLAEVVLLGNIAIRMTRNR
jgi:hypothetical protein